MTSLRKALLYGVAVWLIPFVVASLIFPLRASNRPLFESIMPVAVAGGVVIFAVRYFRSVTAGFVAEGLRLGLLWLAISIAIDAPLMLLVGELGVERRRHLEGEAGLARTGGAGQRHQPVVGSPQPLAQLGQHRFAPDQGREGNGDGPVELVGHGVALAGSVTPGPTTQQRGQRGIARSPVDSSGRSLARDGGGRHSSAWGGIAADQALAAGGRVTRGRDSSWDQEHDAAFEPGR